MAKFEKPFMSISELKEMGLPADALARLAKNPETGAHRLMSPDGSTKVNSKYIFDTQKLQEYLDQHENI